MTNHLIFKYSSTLILVGTIVVLSACQAAPTPVAYTEHDKSQAMQNYGQCLMSNIESMDDGTSDAYTIANAVAKICQDKRIRLTEIQTADANPQVKAMVLRKTLENQAEVVVPMVLKMRAAK